MLSAIFSVCNTKGLFRQPIIFKFNHFQTNLTESFTEQDLLNFS